MFTGIIETIGEIVSLTKNQNNIDFTIKSPLSGELKIDQSVAHNGVCLTVVQCTNETHTVTAIHETLSVTNLSFLQIGDKVNIERCMILNTRLDGHIVQGHVDQMGKCLQIENKKGSWEYTFSYASKRVNLIVEKGSICINGISLTAFDTTHNTFKVALIPYTYAHTTMSSVSVGDNVNLEFDIIGKYVEKLHHIS